MRRRCEIQPERTVPAGHVRPGIASCFIACEPVVGAAVQYADYASVWAGSERNGEFAVRRVGASELGARRVLRVDGEDRKGVGPGVDDDHAVIGHDDGAVAVKGVRLSNASLPGEVRRWITYMVHVGIGVIDPGGPFAVGVRRSACDQRPVRHDV